MLNTTYFKEFLRVFSLIEKNKLKYIVTIAITGLCYPCLNILFSFAYKMSINAVEFNDFSLFYNTCLLFLIAVIIQCLIEPYANYANARLVSKMIYRIKNNVFNHAVKLPVSYFEANHSGDTVLRLTSNIDAIEPIYRGNIRDIMQVVFLGVGAFISMLFMNIQLTLISLLFSVFIYIVNLLFTKNMRKLGDLQHSQIAKLTQSLSNSYSFSHMIKSFSKEYILINKFDEMNKKVSNTSIKETLINELRNGLSLLITNSNKIFVLVYGLVMYINGQIDIGSIVGIISLQAGLINMFASLGGFFASIQNNLASVKRVLELLDTSVESAKYENDMPTDQNRDDIIVYENVSFSYEQNKKVLDNLTFHVKEKQMISIIGPNGSGKSTLVKLLLGYYPPNGNICYKEKALSHYNLFEIRNMISYVSQRPVLLDTTILENIKFGNPNATMEEIIVATKKANIHDHIMSLKEGYESIVGEEGIFLSGGQRQKIAIARALVKNAPIILFDEATSSIDYEDEFDILQTLKSIKGQYTIILVTHRLRSIEDSDWIMVLKYGKIVGQGNHEFLIENNSYYKELTASLN